MLVLKNRGIAFKLIFYILTSSTLIFAGIFGYNYVLSHRYVVRVIENDARDLTLSTANRIASALRSVQNVPQTLSDILSQTNFTKEELQETLKALVESTEDLDGATIAFEPNAFDKKLKYFAPFYYKSGKIIHFKYLSQEVQDYFERDWYRIPKESGRPLWSEPYHDKDGDSFIVATYSVPFYRHINGRKIFTGVIAADISLKRLQDIVSSITIAKSGYGFLLSGNGTILAHTKAEFVIDKTIFDVAKRYDSPRLAETAREMIAGKTGLVQYKMSPSGRTFWLAYAPLQSGGWSLGILFPRDELMADLIELNREMIVLGLIGFISLFVVIALISRSITRPLRQLAGRTKDIAKGNFDFSLPPSSSGDEAGKLTNSFARMKDDLKEYISKLTEVTAARERMHGELKVAHDIQMGIVPKIFPPFPHRPEFDIYAVLEPAKQVGGDLYDFFFLDEDRLCLVIGDVSDKGIPASLFMAVTKTLIKSTMRDTGDPVETFRRVNTELSQDNDSCMFVTAFCGILNVKTGEVQYSNAGHNAPLIIRRGGETRFLQEARTIALGVVEDAKFERGTLTLEDGDALFIYTDGVTEATNTKNELFSENTLKEKVGACQHEHIKSLVDDILNDVNEFSKGMPQSDDITILAIKYHPGQAVAQKLLILKNDISEIKKLENFVREFGKENNLDNNAIHDVNLALEEIVNNIIHYAYDDNAEHLINVRASRTENALVVTVEDDGKSFNPLSVPKPDIKGSIKDRKIGGLGIYFVRKVMDTLDYRRKEDMNIFTMVMRI